MELYSLLWIERRIVAVLRRSKKLTVRSTLSPSRPLTSKCFSYPLSVPTESRLIDIERDLKTTISERSLIGMPYRDTG